MEAVWTGVIDMRWWKVVRFWTYCDSTVDKIWGLTGCECERKQGVKDKAQISGLSNRKIEVGIYQESRREEQVWRGNKSLFARAKSDMPFTNWSGMLSRRLDTRVWGSTERLGVTCTEVAYRVRQWGQTETRAQDWAQLHIVCCPHQASHLPLNLDFLQTVSLILLQHQLKENALMACQEASPPLLVACSPPLAGSQQPFEKPLQQKEWWRGHKNHPQRTRSITPVWCGVEERGDPLGSFPDSAH